MHILNANLRVFENIFLVWKRSGFIFHEHQNHARMQHKSIMVFSCSKLFSISFLHIVFINLSGKTSEVFFFAQRCQAKLTNNSHLHGWWERVMVIWFIYKTILQFLVQPHYGCLSKQILILIKQLHGCQNVENCKTETQNGKFLI